MIHAKNYVTVSKCVKVMTKILWPLFSGHGVYRNQPISERLAQLDFLPRDATP